MKLHILNDLHNEFTEFVPEIRDADVVVLAGDTHPGIKGAQWALSVFPHANIIYVTGNHEYYGKQIPRVDRALSELSEITDLQFLNNETTAIQGVRFIGCTLWSDFMLLGEEQLRSALGEAVGRMNDYQRIRLGKEAGYRKLRPHDTIRFHKQSVGFLDKALAQSFDGPTVVVTHHVPTAKSLLAEDLEQPVRAAYGSNLDWMIEKYQPELWIHGHRHICVDYRVGRTRIVNNARGYVPYHPAENFNPELVINL